MGCCAWSPAWRQLAVAIGFVSLGLTLSVSTSLAQSSRAGFCREYARDYSMRYSSGGIMGGVVRGALGGAVIGGLTRVKRCLLAECPLNARSHFQSAGMN